MERQKKLEAVAASRFLGLMVEYHKKMGEALIHALTLWVPDEHIDDALNDVRYYSDKVFKEVDEDIHRSRRL